MKTIGFIGFGVVNQAIYRNLKNEVRKNAKIYSHDENYKSSKNKKEILTTDICVITVPTPFSDVEIKTYENILSALDFLNTENYTGVILIKSTIDPKRLNYYLKRYNIPTVEELDVVFWPEFLNASTAYTDFSKETFLFGGDITTIEKTVDILKTFFSKPFKFQTGTRQEVMEYKYFRNMILMNHFNFINHMNFLLTTDIRKLNNFHKEHPFNFNTFKIAPDGYLGVNGECLPKDFKIFTKLKNIYNDLPKDMYKYLIRIIKSNTYIQKLNNLK